MTSSDRKKAINITVGILVLIVIAVYVVTVLSRLQVMTDRKILNRKGVNSTAVKLMVTAAIMFGFGFSLALGACHVLLGRGGSGKAEGGEGSLLALSSGALL